MVFSNEEYIKQIESIKQARKKRSIVFMLTVFGDESYDEKRERVFVVAGIMGFQEEWDVLEPIWLERMNGKVFHAADCESDRGEFKDSSHEENLKLYADLTKIIKKTNLMGYGVAVNIKEYEKTLLSQRY